MVRFILAPGTRVRQELFGGILCAPIDSALHTGQSFYRLTALEHLLVSTCRSPVSTEQLTQRVFEEYEGEWVEMFDAIEAYMKQLCTLGIVREEVEYG